ncbi:hypothetical protein ACFLTV_01840 [Chloroflexota bacterium]
MPQIFKALATIAVWVLWISGMVMGFSAFIKGIILGQLYGGTQTPMQYFAAFAVALAYVIGAVVVMILRKRMEKP